MLDAVGTWKCVYFTHPGPFYPVVIRETLYYNYGDKKDNDHCKECGDFSHHCDEVLDAYEEKVIILELGDLMGSPA